VTKEIQQTDKHSAENYNCSTSGHAGSLHDIKSVFVNILYIKTQIWTFGG